MTVSEVAIDGWEATSTGVTRRQVLKWGATLGAAAGVATVVGIPTLVATKVRAVPASAAEPDATPISTLAVRFGTPTDLARTATDQAWTREVDGSVYTYEKDSGSWQPVEQDWQAVLTYGTRYLARWGRPSGGNQLVMVFGTAPPPTPPPTSSSTSTTTTTTTSTTTTTASSEMSPNSTIRGGSTSTSRSGAATANTSQQGRGQLPYTGFDPTKLTLGGLAAIAVGGGLLAIRTRRQRPHIEEDRSPEHL